jgi:hypothetical protein
MRVSTVAGVVICGGIGVVIRYVGGGALVHAASVRTANGINLLEKLACAGMKAPGEKVEVDSNVREQYDPRSISRAMHVSSAISEARKGR